MGTAKSLLTMTEELEENLQNKEVFKIKRVSGPRSLKCKKIFEIEKIRRD